MDVKLAADLDAGNLAEIAATSEIDLVFATGRALGGVARSVARQAAGTILANETARQLSDSRAAIEKMRLRSLTVPGFEAKKGSENRNPPGCPEQGTLLIEQAIENGMILTVSRRLSALSSAQDIAAQSG